MYGSDVADYLDSIDGPKSLVVLRPRPDVVTQPEARGTTAYVPWVTDGRSMVDAVAQFDEWLAATPRIGLWIDSSELTPGPDRRRDSRAVGQSGDRLAQRRA